MGAAVKPTVENPPAHMIHTLSITELPIIHYYYHELTFVMSRDREPVTETPTS